MVRNAEKGGRDGTPTTSRAQVIEDQSARDFMAWLSQVTPHTLAGVAPLEQTTPRYDHLLANWLSAQCGGLWSVCRLSDGTPIAERWQDSQVVEAVVLPVWALHFCDRLFWWSGRELTSADCLSLLSGWCVTALASRFCMG